MKKIIPFIVLMFILSFQLYSGEIFTGGRDMPVAEFQADSGGQVAYIRAYPGGNDIGIHRLETEMRIRGNPALIELCRRLPVFEPNISIG